MGTDHQKYQRVDGRPQNDGWILEVLEDVIRFLDVNQKIGMKNIFAKTLEQVNTIREDEARAAAALHNLIPFEHLEKIRCTNLQKNKVKISK